MKLPEELREARVSGCAYFGVWQLCAKDHPYQFGRSYGIYNTKEEVTCPECIEVLATRVEEGLESP